MLHRIEWWRFVSTEGDRLKPFEAFFFCWRAHTATSALQPYMCCDRTSLKKALRPIQHQRTNRLRTYILNEHDKKQGYCTYVAWGQVIPVVRLFLYWTWCSYMYTTAIEPPKLEETRSKQTYILPDTLVTDTFNNIRMKGFQPPKTSINSSGATSESASTNEKNQCYLSVSYT